MHHPDDHSASELRHTLAEAMRIAYDRRWWFVFTFGLVSSAAFIASHWLPRQYTARTLFERRNDVVLQQLVGAAWNQEFEAQRRSLTFDLKGPAALEAAIQQTDLASAWPCGADGRLTPDSERLRTEYLAKLADRVDVRTVESTPQRDVIEVRLTDAQSGRAAQLVTALRDGYAERATSKMLGLLDDSLEYFTREAERAAQTVREDELKLVELQRAHPGVLPDFGSSVAGEVNGLSYERAELRRKLAELTAAEQGTRRMLGDPTAAPAEPVEVIAEAAPQESPQERALAQEFEQTEKLLEDEKLLRHKTDRHPTVAALRDKLRRLSEERNRLAESRMATRAGDVPRAADQRERRRLETLLAGARNQIGATQARLAAVQARLDEIEGLKSAGADRRQEYLSLSQQLDRDRAELHAWQSQIDPIRRILDAQSRDRGVKFIAVQDPGAVTRPSSPNARVALLACLAIGLVLGGLSVMGVELFDRSYRTAAHVTRSLGIPVLESIDEIVTPLARRRRLVMNLVVLPGATVVLLAFSTVMAAGAYLSIEAPWLYEQVRGKPWSVFWGPQAAEAGVVVQKQPQRTGRDIGRSATEIPQAADATVSAAADASAPAPASATPWPAAFQVTITGVGAADQVGPPAPQHDVTALAEADCESQAGADNAAGD